MPDLGFRSLLPASSIAGMTAPRTLNEVVFVDGVRTPFGKAGKGGQYAETRADDLIVVLIRELLRRNPTLPPRESTRWPSRRPPRSATRG